MNTIITIGRELGSGGRTIGKRVASKLGIPYYDREIIDEAAEKSGLAADFIESNEQKSSLFYKLGMGMSYGFSNKGLPLFDQIYIAQTKVINELADKGSCVIVGRCADYILKERKNLLRVFIYSDMEHRIERAVQYTECCSRPHKKRYKNQIKNAHGTILFLPIKRGANGRSTICCSTAEASALKSVRI